MPRVIHELAPRPDAAGTEEPSRDAGDLVWPLLITFGLLTVVLVNFAFVWIAASGQDEVVESYVTEGR